jgi:hypothetical protein
MGTELVPETLYWNELTRLCARENYIESCRRESFKTYILSWNLKSIWVQSLNLKQQGIKLVVSLKIVFFWDMTMP